MIFTGLGGVKQMPERKISGTKPVLALGGLQCGVLPILGEDSEIEEVNFAVGV
jgi:hypothetical protein